MQLFIPTLLVIIYVAGTFCQKITFDNTDVGGITVGRYYIDGTIGDNVTELLHQTWQPFILITVLKVNASIFTTMCAFSVSVARCVPDPVNRCQCVYNTDTDNVHFVVNGTAGPDLYNATIRAEWEHQNQTNVYSNKNYTVPGPVDAVKDTTTSPGTVHEPTKPTPEDNIALIVSLCVIIPLVVIALVIGIVWYFKAEPKPSKDPAVSNRRMGSKMGSTTKTVESEQSEVYDPAMSNHEMFGRKGSTTNSVESEV